MSRFDDDIDTMLADFDPVTLVFGSLSANAITESWDEDVLPSIEKGVMAAQLALLVKTSAFPGLKIGSSVVVCQQDASRNPILPGVAYTVRDRQRPLLYADGAITHILLEKV